MVDGAGRASLAQPIAGALALHRGPRAAGESGRPRALPGGLLGSALAQHVFLTDSNRPSTHAPSLCLHTMSDSQTPGGVGWGAGDTFYRTGPIPRQTPALTSEIQKAACRAWQPSPSEKSR